MVILHFIDDLGVGGAQTLLVTYIDELTEHRNIVVTLKPLNLYSLSKTKYIALNLLPKKDFWLIVKRLKTIIREERVDIIHSHSYFTNIFTRFVSSNVKIINHYHFADYVSLPNKLGVKIRMCLDILTMNDRISIISVSDFLGKKLKKMFPNNRVDIIENFHNCNQSPQERLKSLKELKIICIGNCNREKNYPLLIKTFEKLKEYPIYVDVFGNGTMLEDLRNEAKNKSLCNLNFKGASYTIKEEINKYDLFLSTSKSESFGLVVLEAMCASLPLVLSKIPAFLEIAPKSATFFTNSDELVSVLKEKLKNNPEPDLTAYKSKLETYSMNNFLEKLRKVYESQPLHP